MGFFNRIGAGLHLAKASWKLVLLDKSLMVFPILSFLSLSVVTAGFFMTGTPLEMIENATTAEGQAVSQEGQTLALVVLFLAYLVSYTITIFFNVALVSCAIRSVAGEDTKVSEGIAAAISHLPGIFVWALISSVVGLLLNVLEKNNKIGEITSAILGTAWSVLTYFVIPIMVVEKANPITSIGRSKTLIFKTWGEGLGGYIGAGILGILSAVPGVLLILVGIFWLQSIVLIVLGVILVFAAALWSTTANSVLRAVLYCYAAKKDIPPDFQEYADSAFYNRAT